jgi:PAS domain S-box-containing protein
MKLRIILLVLSLLGFLSASTGGYLYYSSLKESAFREANRQSSANLDLIKKNLSAYLSENIKPVKALAGMEGLLEMLVRPSDESQRRANTILDLYKEALEVDVCYLMNHEGTTIASSNRDAPDSFLGKNFAFRPYFQQAIHSAPATYLALGVTSKKRGVYHSFPIFEKGEDIPIGLVVIKASIELIEKELNLSPYEVILVTDPQGIIFISNRKEWLYQAMRKMSPQEKKEVLNSRQFGKGPWEWSGLEIKDNGSASDRSGNEYLIHHQEMDYYPGWKIYYLHSFSEISKKVFGPLIGITGPIILMFCILIGLSVFFLYRKASHDILQRRAAENALRKSEERYRLIYHNAPAMLHSVNDEGILVSVSDHWLKALGYDREEVIGKKLSRFLTEDSGRMMEEIFLPEFFRTGVVSDIPYRFVRKNGEIIDTLLSAIGERDEQGNVVRSLAVSIDITERKQTEEALKQAKEELGLYSKDLERQVRKRTSEITSILKYSPSVIYIKDREGRYLMINSRFEALFGIKNEDIRTKTDEDIFPKETAEQFRTNDFKVLEKGISSQVAEQVPHSDGVHTYLSVKFPVYDETGGISGVCGISTDVTDLKKAQDQLRRLSGSIIESQEHERTAIARELHDQLGQMLTALRMDAVWISEHFKRDDLKASERAMSMRSLIDDTIEDVRNMAVRLRPGVLDTLGLVDALEWLVVDFERRTGISCIFENREIPSIDGALATTSYRIAQESLTNITRHTDASRVEVKLFSEVSLLVLSITDDGQGFDKVVMSESQGLGVLGMKERAGLVGGTLEIRSEPKKGTQVHFKAPIDVKDDSSESKGREDTEKPSPLQFHI